MHRVGKRAPEDDAVGGHAALKRFELLVDVHVFEPVVVIEQRRKGELGVVARRRLATEVGDAAKVRRQPLRLQTRFQRRKVFSLVTTISQV